MTSFIDKFKAKVRQLDKPRYDAFKPEPMIKRFNIYKRSLPVGLDKIVVIGVTKEEANWWIQYKLKTKSYQDNTNDLITLIYFDIVPVDATLKELSIYFNIHPITIGPIVGYITDENLH